MGKFGETRTITRLTSSQLSGSTTRLRICTAEQRGEGKWEGIIYVTLPRKPFHVFTPRIMRESTYNSRMSMASVLVGPITKNLAIEVLLRHSRLDVLPANSILHSSGCIRTIRSACAHAHIMGECCNIYFHSRYVFLPSWVIHRSSYTRTLTWLMKLRAATFTNVVSSVTKHSIGSSNVLRNRLCRQVD